MQGSLELFLQSPQCHQPVGAAVSVARPGKQNNWALENFAQEKQWKPTSTPRFIYFFLSLDFSYEYAEKLNTIFFLFPVRISRVMNAKKVVIRQGRQRAMETHLYTMDFFFFFHNNFPRTSRTIPYYFFLCLVSISRIMNAKNLEIREGRQDQWKPTCTPCNFNFRSQKLSYEHAERFPTMFF